MATFKQTVTLSDELSNSFNITKPISSLAYRYDLSASEISCLDDRISSVISVFPTASENDNGLMSKENFIKLSGIDDGANKYVLPCALSGSLGGIKIGYVTTNERDYPVELSDEKAYVFVPWENTTYTSGRGLSLNNNVFSTSADYTTYDIVKTKLSIEGYVISDDNERIWIKNDINGNISGCYMDLSVIKIPISSYELSVANNKLCDNVLYVVDSDYIEAYGQQICSLTMGNTEETKYEGIAVTKPYVDEIRKNILSAVDQISTIMFDKDTDDIEIKDFVTSLSILCNTLKQI